MRLPVDRRRPLSDPGAGQFRPHRPLPVGARHLGVAQELGPDASGGLTASQRGQPARPRAALADLCARCGAAYMAIGLNSRTVTRLCGGPRLTETIATPG